MAEAAAKTVGHDSVSFSIKKKLYKVTLTESDLIWLEENGKNTETIVRIRDIINIKTDAKPEAGDSASQITVIYVKQQKNFMLKRHEVTFTGGAVLCDIMCKQVQEILNAVTDRPKKLLVLINPLSGRSKGPEVYKSKVAPIFEEADIETDVIVTQKAHHAEEIMEKHDLTAVDGVIIVSGDGLYHEYANGLVRRMAATAGEDVNNENYAPPVFPIPVGLIPCGTGNGIAKASVGNYDVASAAYTAVLGYRCKNNMCRVFCDNELVAYSNLLCGYGVWGDLIYAAETRRHQGVARYPIAIFETLFLRHHREMDITVSYKCRPDVDTMNQERLSEYLQPHGTEALTETQTAVASSDQQKPDPIESSPQQTTEALAETQKAVVSSDQKKPDTIESSPLDKQTTESAEAETQKPIASSDQQKPDPIESSPLDKQTTESAKESDTQKAETAADCSVEDTVKSEDLAETTAADCSVEDAVKSEDLVDTDDVKLKMSDTEPPVEVRHLKEEERGVKPGCEMTSFSGSFVAIFTPVSYHVEPFVEWTWDKRMDNVENVTTTYLSKSAAKWAMLKLMYKLMTTPSEMLTGTTPMMLANEWTIKLNNPSDPESENGRKELIVNIDGEIFKLKKPEFQIRLFEETIPIFCNRPKVTGRHQAKK